MDILGILILNIGQNPFELIQICDWHSGAIHKNDGAYRLYVIMNEHLAISDASEHFSFFQKSNRIREKERKKKNAIDIVTVHPP